MIVRIFCIEAKLDCRNILVSQMKAPTYQRAPIYPAEAAELLVYCLNDVFEAPHAIEQPAAVAAESQPSPSLSLVPALSQPSCHPCP